MKTGRLAASLALAAAMTLGATGCGLVAPMGTTEAYAPSDGIDVDVADVAIRNALLVADQTSQNFNVVFTAVNNGASAALLRVTFAGPQGEASADFMVEPGTTLFGDPDGEPAPVLVTLDGVAAGQTLTAFFEIAGASSVERQIPVLDGTLAEYRAYVLQPKALVELAEDVELQSATNPE